MFGDDFHPQIFTRIVIAILPVQCSDCRRSAGVKEAVANFHPLVSFGPAHASGENIFINLDKTNTITFELAGKLTFPFLSYLCSAGTASSRGLLLLWKTGHCSP